MRNYLLFHLSVIPVSSCSVYLDRIQSTKGLKSVFEKVALVPLFLTRTAKYQLLRRSPLSSFSCLKTAKETAKTAKKNVSNLSDCLSTVVIRIAECSIWSEWSYFFFISRHWTLISYKNVSYSTRVQPVSWRHFEPNLFPEIKIPMRFA